MRTYLATPAPAWPRPSHTSLNHTTTNLECRKMHLCIGVPDRILLFSTPDSIVQATARINQYRSPKKFLRHSIDLTPNMKSSRPPPRSLRHYIPHVPHRCKSVRMKRPFPS